MCHRIVETCARGHDSSKLTIRVPCYEWQQGSDTASCSHTAAGGSREAEVRKIQSRVCEECVREIFYELQNAKVDESWKDKKEQKEKQTKTSISAPSETRNPSSIIKSPRQQDPKSITDTEPESIQDTPKKKQTKGKGGTTDAGKLGDAETSGLLNLQPSSTSEIGGGQKPELRRSPRKKQR
ncbi:predicted protein [Sclerotinia sclerotiorum 1980 UF-70]|uniref:Uncharacterized protein n=2 Tax=Sclerotinia sclerotiorum (strain ATCC 18683 / 1980 / Ss-1) TaxID=665079 RepID=A7EI79_SCLS1|nr:predicted protein [Sclerotinia sclerotiorum 1980 UF-70]APA11581.1 hypothetical protein sscle_08g063510 [Sclerotinia sclerotiorum 1980 UF-70]EDO02545.1 predicted protein [Sclerotinia sclerotiorum 1980 UF-70]